jgi:hypothetical protein
MPMRSSRAGLAVLLSLIAGVAPLWSASVHQAARPFVVAIDQPGSPKTEPFLFPIARFTGTEWVNTWPEPDESSQPAPSLGQIPDTWLGGPVPVEWTRWAPEGERLRVKVVAPVRERHGCEIATVLRITGPTDGARDRWARNAVRIAVNTAQPVEWVRWIAPEHREALTVQPVIERTYQAAERPADVPVQFWTETLGALNAAGAVMKVETLVRPDSDAGPVVYYFRALRRALTPRKLPTAIEVHGWIARDDSGAWFTFDTARQVRHGDGQGENRPLAVFRLGQRTYWLTMLIGYEGLAYAIDDVMRGSVRRVVTARAGGC